MGDIVEKMFESIQEYMFGAWADVMLWIATGLFNIVFAIGRLIFELVLIVGANAEILNNILLSMLRLPIVEEVIYYFQIVATALLILKGFWDLLDNYVFLSGQSTTKSATNKIMSYLFAGVTVWIIPEVIEIIIKFGGKLLSDVIKIFRNLPMTGSMENFMGVDTTSTITEKIVAVSTGSVILGPVLYAIVILIALVLMMAALLKLLIDFYVRAGQVMLLTIFLIPASIDLSAGSNGVFTKTMFALIGHVISATFQYFMLMMFTYVLIFPDNVLPNVGGINFFWGIMMRLLFAYGILKTADKTPEVIQSRLANASSGSSAAGFVDNIAVGQGKKIGGATMTKIGGLFKK